MKNRKTMTRHLCGIILTLAGLTGALASPGFAQTQATDPSWTMTESLMLDRAGHTATLLPDGRVLVVGGWRFINFSTVTNSAELYDPATGKWSNAGGLRYRRAGHTATLLQNGQVLIAGGSDYGYDIGTFRRVNVSELYDPATGQWRTTGSFTTIRTSLSATLLQNGKVLAVGGSVELGQTIGAPLAELYDPATGTWSSTGTPATVGVLTLLPDGKVLSTGGKCDENGHGCASIAELYDPASGTWRLTATPPGFSVSSLTLLPNGKVLAVGGVNANILAAQYDPATETWNSTGAPSFWNQTATLLSNGKVLITGGFEPGVPDRSELYDPSTGTCSVTAPLNAARTAYTATPLPNGKVLVAGGADGDFDFYVQTLNSAELFDAATAPGANTLQFNAASYSASEGDGRAAITVSRTGDTSSPATINYATTDAAGLNNCNVTNGIASPRCDYADSVGTLRFGSGEASKTIFIPIVDDSFGEGVESFTITLSSPSGAGLGASSSAIVTIADNDAASGANPIDGAGFFIRQHYIDFLGREPEPGGYQGWQDILNNCAPGDTACDRVEISAGFFRSPEFQTRGYFIYRFYSTLGRIPQYSEFMPDLAKVSGFLSPEQLEASKAAYIQEFTTRPEFRSRYDALTEPAAYVNGLLQATGLTEHPSKDTWVAGLTNGTMTRAQVLRALVESPEVYHKYYNESFVVMQYFGYLKRDPDILYLDWVQTMNQNGGDYREMINGFVNSTEYRQRFGP